MIHFFKYQILNSTLLRTRLIDEHEIRAFKNQLNPYDLNLLNEIKSINRQKEFITIRLLLKQFFNDNCTLYYRDKKPYLNNNYFISISHKNQELIICLNQKNPIGIDIEKIDPKISKIKSKFCNQVEISNLNENISTEILTKYWCAKEATFKCLDYQENIFLSDITVEICSKSRGKSEIKTLKFKLDFKIIDNEYVICHAQKET